jgi:hypothetical protein
MRWVGQVTHVGEESELCKVLVGKPERKRPLRRPRHRWEDGMRMYLRDIFWVAGGAEWMQLALDRDWCWGLVNTVMNLKVLAPHS